MLGDDTQAAWDDAPEWQRTSAVNGVKFTIANPDAPPSASHDSWLAEKAATGWKYGAVKNPDAKEHPCFVPYAELPHPQRVKDALFQAVVRAVVQQQTPANSADVESAGAIPAESASP